MKLFFRQVVKKIIENKNKLLLISLWFFHVINNYIWLKIDTYPLIWDSSMHFMQSVQISGLLQKLSVDSFLKIVTVSKEYSYFVPLATALFYNFFGMDPDTAILINSSIFLYILIFSVYGITKNIQNEKSGLLAAFLVTTYPIVFGHSRVFMYDLPLTAMVCLIIYAFQTTNNFKKKGRSLFFGITLGLGMITKFTCVVFIMAAFSYYIYRGLLNFKSRNINTQEYLKQKINFLSAILIALIIISTWYLPNLYDFLRILFSAPEVYKEVHPALFSAQSLLYYFFRLINYQVSFLLFLVFAAGLAYFIKIKLQNKLFLVFWIIIPYFVFTFLYYKSVRNTLPYLPAIAIISSIGIYSIQRKIIRLTAVAIIIAVSTVQFFAYSYGIRFLPSVWKINIFGDTILLFNQEGSENAMEQHRAPLRQDWKTHEALNTISRYLPRANTEISKVFIIPDDPRIHSPLTTWAYLKKLPISFAVGSWENIADSKADIVITKDINWLTPPYFLERINKSVNWFNENIKKFSLVEKISLPDNSNLLIYKRN